MKLFDLLIVTFLVIAVGACVGDSVREDSERPNIVEVFACGDYCPGPEEKYQKRVYEGVTDLDECRKLNGRLYTFIGWGQHTVCEVK